MFRRIDQGDMRVFLAKTLWTPDSFEGKLTLDAGCGFGRYTYFAAQFGAEVVGLDLSAAIESARINTAHLPNVHLVQGDLLDLPFREATFDRIFSIGVLHHTPEPSVAFASASHVLRSDGEFSIWVYDKADSGREAINSFVRSITKCLPHPILWKICAFPAKVSQNRYLSGIRMVITSYVIIGSSRVGNFDWYSPQYQHHLTEREVLSWFNSNGFEKVVLISPPARGFGSSFGAKGLKAGTGRHGFDVERAATSFDKVTDSD